MPPETPPPRPPGAGGHPTTGCSDDPQPLRVVREVAAADRGRVVLSGELDMTGVADVLRAAAGVAARGRLVEIDVRALTFIDSTGAQALVDAVALVRSAGADAVTLVAEPGSHVARILGLTATWERAGTTPSVG